TEEVVRVLMPDGDPEPAVLLQAVTLEQAVADTPAEEEPVGPVATGQAVPHDGSLRAAAWMQPQVGVVLADTPGDRPVVGLLEADPVAMVVPHDAVLDHHAEGAVEIDPCPAAAVQMGVGSLVPLDDEGLDPCSTDVRAAD